MLSIWLFVCIILVCSNFLQLMRGANQLVATGELIELALSEEPTTELSAGPNVMSTLSEDLEAGLVSEMIEDIWQARRRISLESMVRSLVSTDESYGDWYRLLNDILARQTSSRRELSKLKRSLFEDGSFSKRSVVEESQANRECRTSLKLMSFDRCLEAERDTENSLNNSFPGTQAAIEENCGRTSFLLANCWPHQLKTINELLNNRNKSIQSNTEFPLPAAAIPLNEAKSVAGCPSARIDAQVLDRITWMWLNLCMDRKFRQDYVDHLQCLSLWNLDRAQLVCNNEYKWMKNNLQDRMSSSVTLEPKIICCMFDMFLRCVYRQARHDCGRSGARFVVNFMSRIGTDDLKFICNRELRTWHKHSNVSDHKTAGLRGGPANGNQERGPFIEGHYCADPRFSEILKSIQQPAATPDERLNTLPRSYVKGVLYGSGESNGASSVTTKVSYATQALLIGSGILHLTSDSLAYLTWRTL